jgi:MSHA pilin protein MshC
MKPVQPPLPNPLSIPFLPRQAGFTMVELIGVMVIMAILSLVAVPRFFDRDTFDARAFHDQALAMLRYAQKTAVAQNKNVFIRLNGVSVAACFDKDCTVHVAAPSGKNSGSTDTLNACSNDAVWFCEALPRRVTLATVPVFYFSPLGQPFTLGTPPVPFTGALNMPVVGGGMERQIVVEPETGYVHP